MRGKNQTRLRRKRFRAGNIQDFRFFRPRLKWAPTTCFVSLHFSRSQNMKNSRKTLAKQPTKIKRVERRLRFVTY